MSIWYCPAHPESMWESHCPGCKIEGLTSEGERKDAVIEAAERLMSGWPAYWVKDVNGLLESLAAVSEGLK